MFRPSFLGHHQVIYLIQGNYTTCEKISPITDPMCPEGSEKLRFPDYMKMAQNGGRLYDILY